MKIQLKSILSAAICGFVLLLDAPSASAQTLNEIAKLLASDGAAADLFGFPVAVSGTTAVIGASGDDDQIGSAYVFVRSGGIWSQQAKLLASDGAVGDQFGAAVAVDGDIAVVGARRDDDNGSDSGSAYVFVRSGGIWSQQAKLLASDGAMTDQFGAVVAMSGTTAVVSAHRDDDNGSDSGSAYVFVRSGGIWSQQAKLLADDGATGDVFGITVAVDGDIAVAGAPNHDDNGSDSGSAYLFDLASATVTMSEVAELLASDGAANDMFSRSAVAVSGTTAVIGAAFDDDNGTNSGSAYVFALASDDEGPITSSVVATPNPVALNNLVTLTANVDDTTTGGSNIAAADYTVDGGTPVGMAAQDSAFDEVSEIVTGVVPAFAGAGVVQLCVSGTDSPGNTGAEDCTFLAVYDPAAGFVAGGGWIDSPANACQLTAACRGLTGKANFGFIAKYQQGAQVPTGNTEFQFKAGDLNFHSGAYEWLVVANHRAQYKGTGTINGGGNYGFKLFAIDANLTPSTDVDLFRIKIWDKDNDDTVVYDNELGAADDADPTTEIGGGSIKIHAQGN